MTSEVATSTAEGQVGRPALHFDSLGSGPVIVLLHGFPELRTSWRHQLPALAAAGFRAIAPDLRGYGLSHKPRGIDAYRLDRVAGDVVDLITSLNQRVVLVGHDWGAVIAWHIAAEHPQLIRRLAILNVPHPALYARELRRSFRQKVNSLYQLYFQLPLLPELTMKLYGGRLLRRMGRFTEEEIAEYRRAWRGSLTPMLNYYRALPRSRRVMTRATQPIDCPVLILWGEREPVFLASALEGTERFAPDHRIVRFPRIGHFVQHDAADRVNEELIAFARG